MQCECVAVAAVTMHRSSSWTMRGLAKEQTKEAADSSSWNAAARSADSGAGNSGVQVPDNRLTVRAGPLGQLADHRPGPRDGLEQPKPVKTAYGTAKNTWAFLPTTTGNFTRTPGGSARSRHLSLGVALGASAFLQHFRDW